MTPTRMENGRAHLRSQAGFSLVEVMSALVILAIAMTAVFATFLTQQKSFATQSRVAEMQQNLRQAVEYMSRDIRMAGYGIPGDVVIPDGVIASGVTSIRSLYAKDNTAGPDQIYILYMFDMDANQPPTSDNGAGVAANAASIAVQSIAGFLSTGGELVLVTDNTTADLYETSGAVGNTLSFGGGYAGSWHTKTYPAGVTVAKARFVRYFIDVSDPAHPTLMVDRMGGATPQPVADDIENIQFEYGLETSTPADGVVDSWVSNPSSPQLTQIRQVRLQLVARTRLPEAGWTETRPGTENGIGNWAAGTTPDGYRRRTYSIVVDVRNSGV